MEKKRVGVQIECSCLIDSDFYFSSPLGVLLRIRLK